MNSQKMKAEKIFNMSKEEVLKWLEKEKEFDEWAVRIIREYRNKQENKK